jgi:hypothetical protein
MLLADQAAGLEGARQAGKEAIRSTVLARRKLLYS